MNFDAEDSTPERADALSPANLFPWPPAEGESSVQAFVETWRESTFHPARFFAALPAEDRLGPSMLYFLILGITVAALGLFWGTMIARPELDSAATPSAFAVFRNISPLVGFLFSPVVQIIALFLGAAVTQVMLLILVPQRGPYGRTVRVYCYSHSPALFAVVPFIGGFVGAIWSMVVAIIGLREAHRTSTGRAAAVVLLPTLLLFIAFMVLMAVVVAGVLMMAK